MRAELLVLPVAAIATTFQRKIQMDHRCPWTFCASRLPAGASEAFLDYLWGSQSSGTGSSGGSGGTSGTQVTGTPLGASQFVVTASDTSGAMLHSFNLSINVTE
jgi:hypothetical protein